MNEIKYPYPNQINDISFTAEKLRYVNVALINQESHKDGDKVDVGDNACERWCGWWDVRQIYYFFSQGLITRVVRVINTVLDFGG